MLEVVIVWSFWKYFEEILRTVWVKLQKYLYSLGKIEEILCIVSVKLKKYSVFSVKMLLSLKELCFAPPKKKEEKGLEEVGQRRRTDYCCHVWWANAWLKSCDGDINLLTGLIIIYNHSLCLCCDEQFHLKRKGKNKKTIWVSSQNLQTFTCKEIESICIITVSINASFHYL